MYKCKIITYCSYFEPVFQGEKSRLFILQQCIIYLNYMVFIYCSFKSLYNLNFLKHYQYFINSFIKLEKILFFRAL